MEPQKVRAYGGLLVVSKKQYLLIQTGVFGIIAVISTISLFHDLNRFFWGNTWLFIGTITLLEILEMAYILRKFSKN